FYHVEPCPFVARFIHYIGGSFLYTSSMSKDKWLCRLKIGFLVGCAVFLVGAETPTQYQPSVSKTYDGGYRSDFPAEQGLVQTLLGTAPLDIYSQLGITPYRGGFQHPVSVRFADGVPALNENTYFYVEPGNPNQDYSQTLVVNVEAYARRV